MVNCKHIGTVLFAFLENLLISGTFGGWIFITPILKQEGVYSHLCRPGNVDEWKNVTIVNAKNATFETCIEQTEIYNLVFTLATAISTSSTLLIGFMFQKLGTWVCRISAVVLNAMGCLCMANASINRPELLFPGMICLALSASFFYMTNMQYANLFAKARSTIIAFTTGAFFSSSMVLWVFSLLYPVGLSFSNMFYMLGSLCLFSLLDTFVFTAKSFIPFPVPEGFKYGLADCARRNQTGPRQSTENENLNLKLNDVKSEQSTDQASVLSIVKTLFYWTTIVQMAILHVCNEFFQSTFDTWLRRLTSEQRDIDTFTDVYGVFLLAGGLVAAPVTGLIFDSVKRHFVRRHPGQRSANLKALMACSTFTSVMGVLFTSLLCATNLHLQYATLVVYVFFRVAVYSNCAIALATFYPPQMVAILLGIGFVVAALCSLLRYPMLSLVLREFGGNFTYIYIVCLFFCLLSFVQPAYIYRVMTIETKSTRDASQLHPPQNV